MAIREYYKQLYGNKSDKLDEMGEFLERQPVKIDSRKKQNIGIDL